MELLKQKFNTGSNAGFYYWKENNGLEIDLLIDTGENIIAHEIKSTLTYNDTLLKSLQQWLKVSKSSNTVLLYNGKIELKKNGQAEVMNWRNYKLNF